MKIFKDIKKGQLFKVDGVSYVLQKTSYNRDTLNGDWNAITTDRKRPAKYFVYDFESCTAIDPLDKFDAQALMYYLIYSYTQKNIQLISKDKTLEWLFQNEIRRTAIDLKIVADFPCEECNSSGMTTKGKDCPRCNGFGVYDI